MERLPTVSPRPASHCACLLVGSFLWSSRQLPLWADRPGAGLLDGGVHYYNTYQTKDNKYMAVGALEPQFYAKLIQGDEARKKHPSVILTL